MKYILCLLVVFEFACTSLAVAKNIDNNAEAPYNFAISDVGIDYHLSGNSEAETLQEFSEKPGINYISRHDDAALNVGQSVDLSEPSSRLLLAVGLAFAALAKWRKSLNES